MADLLRTNVSKAYWCNPSSGYAFEEAKLGTSEDASRSWLDRLLNGGIILPGSEMAITILLTGPPGTGKSTLAMELAYRWSDPEVWPAESLKEGEPRILYITTEAPVKWVIDNAKTYGWEIDAKHRLLESQNEIAKGKVTVARFEPWELAKAAKPNTLVDLISSFAILFRHNDETADRRIRLQGGLEALIIDSLNTIPTPDKKDEVFGALSKLASSGPRVIIMVLDTSPQAQARDVWEFASDIVIRLDRNYAEAGKTGYMIRTIELVKARYQNHVLGRHQFKIQEGLTEKIFKAMVPSERMRAHPYRTEGGIFIFPSIHYVLSGYKRNSPTDKKKDDVEESYVTNLNYLLGGGYPSGRCTALVGQRGGHKSHLAYREILGRVGSTFSRATGKARDRKGLPIEKALIVSLRDDEGMVRQTIQGILMSTDRSLLRENEREKLSPQKAAAISANRAKEKLKEYEENDLLEIAYYPPGYITPEEFFHRLMLSIHRLKLGGGQQPVHVTLLFNSLDQLSSRFPLCAHEPIFIPGIIQMLTAEEVSSFFVTANDNQPDKDAMSNESYGLETMAELILVFKREQLTWPKYRPYLNNAFGPSRVDQWAGRPAEEANWQRQAVIACVGRYAGGQAAGAEGILDLIDDKHWLRDLCAERDLYLLPPEPVKVDERSDHNAGAPTS